MADFVHSHSSLLSDVSQSLPTYEIRVTHFTTRIVLLVVGVVVVIVVVLLLVLFLSLLSTNCNLILKK
jgi:hypothetical protein